jgi:hypothetical protein
VWIYDGANNVVDAGEQIARVQLQANNTIHIRLARPHYCQVSTFPKVKTSAAGQVDVTLHGAIASVIGP